MISVQCRKSIFDEIKNTRLKDGEVMMKRITAIGVIMVVLSTGNMARSEDCGIVNPSFEANGWIPDIRSNAPDGWTVDMPSGKFRGYAYTNWASSGRYSLTLYTDWASFSAGDMATVSQDVNLVDVPGIAFDIKLDTDMPEWDPNICAAVLLIDGDVVWDSTSAGFFAKGEYAPEVCVDKKYRTEGLHSLSLGIRINVNDSLYETYSTSWDMVDCNVCPGPGFIEGDISGDCYVDYADVDLLAQLWLADGVDPNDAANLSHVGDDPNSYAIIDFHDFAMYALIWEGDMTALKDEIAFNWLNDGIDPDYEYNLYGEGDIRARGEINFFDLAVLGRNWLQCSSSGEE
ncbi:MAG: hypothetical protein JXN61_17170 [Sedimentisphaerales bacterium]|nr:hypothetical protein [Sedimentisphaerales bacterium]